jgi:tRNA (cmo5U34)-methyltransferase
MSPSDIVSMFNEERAKGYDAQATLFSWRPTFDEFARHLLRALPEDARILCVGVGTGLELVPLALAGPGWRFLALDPSAAMLERCRLRAREAAVEGRCEFFPGFLEELPEVPAYDAATCLLVSHFMMEPGAREAFFRQIAARLKPGGLFINGDLAGDQASPCYEALEEIWFRGLQAGGQGEEQRAKLREAYRTLVAIRPVAEVERLLESAGFTAPTLFYQAVLLHTWFAVKGSGSE